MQNLIKKINYSDIHITLGNQRKITKIQPGIDDHDAVDKKTSTNKH